MKLTNWFYGTTPPVRPGVYETRHRATNGYVLYGFSYWEGHWCRAQETVTGACRHRYKGDQQNKEWRGLAEEPK